MSNFFSLPSEKTPTLKGKNLMSLILMVGMLAANFELTFLNIYTNFLRKIEFDISCRLLL